MKGRRAVIHGWLGQKSQSGRLISIQIRKYLDELRFEFVSVAHLLMIDLWMNEIVLIIQDDLMLDNSNENKLHVNFEIKYPTIKIMIMIVTSQQKLCNYGRKVFRIPHNFLSQYFNLKGKITESLKQS